MDNAAVSERRGYAYRVESAEEQSGRVRVSLVKQLEREETRHLRRHVEVLERTVLFSQTFRPMFDLTAMESYATNLSLVARHAAAGTFGCFVQTATAAGNVEVCLWERWFDGREIHTDELARRVFDASDETALVASVEAVADLRAWAERQNEAREAAYAQELDDDDARSRAAAEREAASAELNEILAALKREV
jgi:hypothetical protein